MQLQVGRHLVWAGVDKKQMEVFMMPDAVRMGHLRLVEWILNLRKTKGALIDDSQETLTGDIDRSTSIQLEDHDHESGSLESQSDPRLNLLYEALTVSNEPLIRLLLLHGVTGDSQALYLAMQSQCSLAILRLLVSHTKPEPGLIFSAMTQFKRWTWLKGLYKDWTCATESRIVLLIESLPQDEFDGLSELFVTMSAEIGSIAIMTAVVDKGGNINQEDGYPLYSALVLGYHSFVKYWLRVPGTQVDAILRPLSRWAFLSLCLFDHIALLYASLLTLGSFIITAQCQTEGYAYATLNAFTWERMSCVPWTSADVSQSVSQLILAFGVSIGIFGLMQWLMPLHGILLGLLAWRQARRKPLIHPSP